MRKLMVCLLSVFLSVQGLSQNIQDGNSEGLSSIEVEKNELKYHVDTLIPVVGFLFVGVIIFMKFKLSDIDYDLPLYNAMNSYDGLEILIQN